MALSLQGNIAYVAHSQERRDWAETILTEHDIEFTVRNVSSMPPMQQAHPSMLEQTELPSGEYVFFVRKEDLPLAQGLLKE